MKKEMKKGLDETEVEYAIRLHRSINTAGGPSKADPDEVSEFFSCTFPLLCELASIKEREKVIAALKAMKPVGLILLPSGLPVGNSRELIIP
jgi:hypothetical protein